MKKKIAFVAGHTRGGTTLLTLLLGQQKGFFPAGELKRIWQAGFVNNELCTCGVPFRSCEFWNAVVNRAFGGWRGINPKEVDSMSKELYPAVNFPKLVYPFLRGPAFQKQLDYITDVYKKLYTAIMDVSGSHIIIDASKVSLFGFLLDEIPMMDVYVIQLNRHICGVAHSKRKKRKRREVHWDEAYMSRHSTLFSSYKWVSRNLSSSVLRYYLEHFIHIRYEDLAKYPKTCISDLNEFIDEPTQDLDYFHGNHEVYLKESHMFGGNPMRFDGELTRIYVDDDWRHEMGFHRKALAILFGWPLLWLYGYLGRRHR